MNKVLLIFSIFFYSLGFAQVTDDFTDGDFTANPVWTPSTPSDFVVASNRLQSNNLVASSTFYISTPSTFSANCQWEF